MFTTTKQCHFKQRSLKADSLADLVKMAEKMRLERSSESEPTHVHDWVKTYERLWSHQLSRIKQRSEQASRQQQSQQQKPEKEN